MPYSSVVKRRKVSRESHRRRRDKAKRETIPVALPKCQRTDDPVTDLCRWAKETLVVPPGHPKVGTAMSVPAFFEAFLRDVMSPGIREGLLCMARKNAKSACCAVLVLAYLVGPLARAGWRCGIVSIDKSKANELKIQIEAIALASGLADQMRFLRSPAPGRITAAAGTVDILSADETSGHASGYDLILFDELGLTKEKHRGLVSGLKSSTSARSGIFVAISIFGTSPFIPEMAERARDDAVTVHLYQPAEGDCASNDETAWREGNPGIEVGLKPIEYMQDRARLTAMNPGDNAYFRAEDMNLPGSPNVEMIVTPDDWRALTDGAKREGGVCIAIDAGGSSSMTAAALVWPATGRLEVYGAYPVSPGFDLHERGKADGVGTRYQVLNECGELWTYGPRRTTPVVEFLRDLREKIAGQDVIAMGADRYRKSEVLDYLTDAGISWPLVWRGQGASPSADGSADVRSFQRGVIGGWLHPVGDCRIMVSAIAESVIRRDGAGNPALDRGRSRGRIDPASAAVIAVGIADRERNKPRRGYRSAIVG